MKKLLLGLALFINVSVFSQEYTFEKGIGKSVYVGARYSLNTPVSNLNAAFSVGIVVNYIQLGFFQDRVQMSGRDFGNWGVDLGYFYTKDKFGLSPIIGASFYEIPNKTITSLYFGTMFTYTILDDLAFYVKGTTNNWIDVGFMFLIP